MSQYKNTVSLRTVDSFQHELLDPESIIIININNITKIILLLLLLCFIFY